MTKLIAQEEDGDSEFEEMIKWYNAQVFNWFNPNNRGKGRKGDSSSGIDEVMNQMEDLDMNNSEMEPQSNNGEDWSALTEQIHSAGTQVIVITFFYFSYEMPITFFHF
jgi:hypothetical protein